MPTATCTVPGVVPLCGVAASHVPPLLVPVVTLKLIGPGVPDTITFCDAGAEPPATCVNVSDEGAAVIVPAVTVRVTDTVAGLLPAPGAVTVIVP